MIVEIENRLNNIVNPVSGKTLKTEGRWQQITFKEGKLVAQYNRDGITPAEKRVIETEIQKALEGILGVENIMIKTTSSTSQDVFRAIDNKKAVDNTQTTAAQIKPGHGTVGNKKSVPGVNKVIAIGSGKGGVGKSTFTANLAVSLNRLGKRVGVIDADIYGPSLPMIFGKRDEKPRSNSDKKIIPIEAYGIEFMSFGLFINEEDPVIWRGPMLGGVLNQFLFDVDWNGLDYLLIDLPPGTGDIQLSMIQNANVDNAIVISTPQDVALLDAKKGYEMFKKLNLPILGMVENMSSFICDKCGSEHFIFGKGGVEKAVEKLGIPFLGKIPLEMELRTGSDEGFPYMAHEEFEGRVVWRSYMDIAERVVRASEVRTEEVSKKGIISKILGLGK